MCKLLGKKMQNPSIFSTFSVILSKKSAKNLQELNNMCTFAAESNKKVRTYEVYE